MSVRSTVRKSGSYYADNARQQSRLYNDTRYRPLTDWIGKYFIPIGSFPRDPHMLNYISEYEVMKKTGSYAYRIAYVNGSKKSKPSIEYRPAQLNLILNPDNLILDVLYF